MYKKGLLIYNGNAGQTESNEKLSEVVGILSEGIDELTLIKTKNPGDAEEITKEKGEEYEIVMFLGGDGTVHEGINGIAHLQNPPIVGIIPGGTCNDFARGLNVPLKLSQSPKAILKGKTKEVDIGKVNDRYFTNFTGVGLITEISENVNPTTKNIMGRISYYSSTIRSMGENDNFKFTLKTENEKIEDEAGMVIIVNGNHVGSIKVPNKSISMNDGLFDIFIVYNAGISLLVKYLTQKDTFEDKVSEEEIKHLQARKISLRTEENMSTDTDGEVYLQTPLEIEVKKKKLKFIVGE
ncbi:diacylglycerol kinase family lipid kinase [Clostridium sp. D2Q-11]|uniref:Diacylglycerol kinase family lipid kinase n=1 Tax=Anaeromonas frigoriresistens TaxID=2683708 RepID=A0A942UZJ3_9FIRM|nr:diacylglycerol kinase family protein [Anaeromonas frigoriresistens]MBS4539176.1 diacylglycerol kinase family lipid kinase [Anaeromonas frigoriresistens]